MAAEQAAIAALDAIESAALVDVTLPKSGGRVRVEPSNLVQLMADGLLPQPLLDAVLSSGSVDRDPRADFDAGVELMHVTRERAAAAIRAIWSNDTWVPVTVAPERFGKWPAEDRREVVRVALGEEIAEVGIDDLATFRDDAAGPAPGEDGADVQPAAVEPARPDRAARRARSRPGARG